jgi:VirE N-terminal domain
MNLENCPQIAFFRHFTKKGENVRLQTMLDGIMSGRWSRAVMRLRELEKDSPAFDRGKHNLPLFMLSATSKGGFKADDVESHSGLLQLDIDDVGAADAGNLRDRIGEDRHIMAAWISPSGVGVKGIMKIPASIQLHKASFEAAADHMREAYAVKIDPACSNVNRLCYVSHDPDLVLHAEAVPLEVPSCHHGTQAGGLGGDSSISLHTAFYILHNSLLKECPDLSTIYQRHVARHYGRPTRGQRNGAMVEIVASCFCVVSPEILAEFAEEYYRQHLDAFADYPFATYQREVASLIEGCTQSYPKRLTEAERQAYAYLTDERDCAAFRIAQSLSKCESDKTLPPPLFALSCHHLGVRLGIMDTPAWRILRGFEKAGIIKLECAGKKRARGQKGESAIYRWMLCPLPGVAPSS